MRGAEGGSRRSAARWVASLLAVVVLAAVALALLGRAASGPPAVGTDTAMTSPVDSSTVPATTSPDTSVHADSAAGAGRTPEARPGLPPRPAPAPLPSPVGERPDPWAAALRGLDSSQVRLDAPAQMTVQQVATVWLRIARRAALPAPPRDRRGRATADTVLLVGDSARACLTVPRSWAFAEATPACRSQLVIPGTENAWRWEVTPGEAQDSVPVSASLTAIIPTLGQKEFYSGTVTVRVTVAPCPLYRPACLLQAASTWEGIVTAIGAIAAAVAGLLAWLRKRGARRPGDAPAPAKPVAPG